MLKIDISKFFDTIRWDKLQGILKDSIREDDVLELIREECMARTIDSEGNLVSKELGIHQGFRIFPYFCHEMCACDAILMASAVHNSVYVRMHRRNNKQ